MGSTIKISDIVKISGGPVRRNLSVLQSFGVALAVSFPGYAAAELAGDALVSVCRSDPIRSLCLTTCAPACRDEAFLKNNVAYCIDNNLVYGDLSDIPQDRQACRRLLSEITGEPLEPQASAETELASAGEDCSQYDRQSDRRRCELAKVTPQCAPSPTALEQDAVLLVREIEMEIDQYGDLLTVNWGDVNNRALLCEFSLDQLDAHYEASNSNPEVLRGMQGRAQALQACQSDWETWVREYPSRGISDSLLDNVARDAEEQLSPLKKKIASLRVDVGKLESAAETLVGIIDLHLLYCAPGGSGASAPAGDAN